MSEWYSSYLSSDILLLLCVQEASELYTPGLTYVEMLTYQARLRLSHRAHYSTSSEAVSKCGSSEDMVNIQQRVEKVLDIMGLLWCKDKLIATVPPTRGALGTLTHSLTHSLTHFYTFHLPNYSSTHLQLTHLQLTHLQLTHPLTHSLTHRRRIATPSHRSQHHPLASLDRTR